MERGRPRRRLARAPSRAAAARTPTRRPAEQPLKRRQHGAASAGAEAPGQWPLCSGAHGCGWVRACECRATARAGALSCPAPSAKPGPSRGRLASRGDRSERRPPLPGQPPPWHAGLWPTSAPPPPALAALRPPLRPRRRFPARRIPGNCARPRPALPLGLLGLVVHHAGRPARVGCPVRSRRSALGGPRGTSGCRYSPRICELRALSPLGYPSCPVPASAPLYREGGARARPPARAFVCLPVERLRNLYDARGPLPVWQLSASFLNPAG